MTEEVHVVQFHCTKCKIAIPVGIMMLSKGRIILVGQCSQCDETSNFDVEKAIVTLYSITVPQPKRVM